MSVLAQLEKGKFNKVKDGSDLSLDDMNIKGDGKVIGVYFSAHWCPPCRTFTPTLVKFYEAMKASAEAKEFEIIFVSFDRDEKSFNEYFDTMPWCTLKLSDEYKDGIAKEAGVQGIPQFLVMKGCTGEVIKDNARGDVEAWNGSGKVPDWLTK